MNLYEPIPGANNFKWIEALALREWGWSTYPSDTQKENIIDIAKRLQQIRDHFKRAIHVRSWLRPIQYNIAIGGAELSAHLDGKAVDFTVDGYQGIGGADSVRSQLERSLCDLGLRMEKTPGSSWIHIDTKEPGLTGRYFTP